MFLVTITRRSPPVTITTDRTTPTFPLVPLLSSLTNPVLSPTILIPTLPSTPSEEHVELKLLTSIITFSVRSPWTALPITDRPPVMASLATLICNRCVLMPHLPSSLLSMLVILTRPTLTTDMPMEIGIRPCFLCLYSFNTLVMKCYMNRLIR